MESLAYKRGFRNCKIEKGEPWCKFPLASKKTYICEFSKPDATVSWSPCPRRPRGFSPVCTGPDTEGAVGYFTAILRTVGRRILQQVQFLYIGGA